MMNPTPRDSRQFPGRFTRLPGISNSPLPSSDNQLVPMRSLNYDDGDISDRQMELKLSVLEKSNRALLDEVVRLQSEVKHLSHISDRTHSDERQSQNALEAALRSATDVIAQLNGRVRRAEERLQEDKAIISALSNQVKNTEMLALTNQQDASGRLVQQTSKIQDLQAELNDAVVSKQNLEKIAYQLAEEVKQTKARVETQAAEFSTSILELKKRAKMLEEETRLAKVEARKKDGEVQTFAEVTTTQLRAQVESRLAELRDFLVDIRNKHDEEVHTKRNLEQQLNNRVTELQAAISEQSRRREEAIHALEVMQREKEHAAEVERNKLQNKLADVAEDVTKKILQRDMRIREELQAKSAQLQQLIEAEQEAQRRLERAMKEELQQQFVTERNRVKEDLKTLQEEYRTEKKRTHDVIHKLEDGVNLLEQHIEEQKKQQEKLISAEIKSRKATEKAMEDQISDANKRLSVTATTLKSSIDSLWEKLNSQNEKVKKQLQESVDNSLSSANRQLLELEAKVLSTNNKMETMQDRLETKIEAARQSQMEGVRENLDALVVWKSMTDSSVKDHSAEIKRLSDEVLLLKEREKTLRSEMASKFQTEALTRERDNELLRAEIEKLAKQIPPPAPPPKTADIDTLQSSIRKLAESIQTVKTVLGMKIQSEQKLRESTLQNIQEQVDDLRKTVEDK